MDGEFDTDGAELDDGELDLEGTPEGNELNDGALDLVGINEDDGWLVARA